MGINSREQRGSSSVCVSQPTRTHRPLMQKKSCSEELFQKHCLRRTVSEDLVLKEELLTSDTPDIPDIPDVPDIPDIPKEAVKQFSTIVISSEALA